MTNKSKTMNKVNFISPEIPSKEMRKLMASKEILDRLDRSPFHAWGTPAPIRKRDQTWSQAKVRHPLLKPMGDSDKDGVKNIFDCRPFNKRTQGFFHKEGGVSDDVAVSFEEIDKLKTLGDVRKLEGEILRKDK